MPSDTGRATTTVETLTAFLNSELRVSQYSDAAFNGLQIDAGVTGLSTVGFAVDAGYSVMEEAIARGCQLLVVHHGVLWGKAEPIVGPWARKLALCLKRGLSLYAAHLPLDGHAVLGNAAQIASELLKASEIVAAFPYQGAPIGVCATLASAMPVQAIAELLTQCPGGLAKPLVLPFGKRDATRIGIATGSATFLIPEAARQGLDLFITGEPKQEAYHVAKEYGVSVICMGHYASETFGVRALQRVLEREFGIHSQWIDEPTGI